jgi:lipopolysaccharide export system permease protein
VVVNRLTRYVGREVLLAWLGVTVVLVVVLLTNRLIQFMADAASGDIPPQVIFTLLGLKAVANLGVVLPGSFFLGCVMALGRLYRDSEMTALAGCGIGPTRVYTGLFALALPLAVGVAGLSLSLGPAAERQADAVLANAEQQARFAGVQPGRFVSPDNRLTLYVERIGEDGTLHGVFAERRVDGGRQIWVAERGRRQIDGVAPGEFLVLEDGWRYDGRAGEAAWRVMDYAEHGVRIARPEPVQPGVGRDAEPLASLWASDAPGARAELQRRLSFPLMVLVLALGSLPLARSDPRSGRYGRVVTAVLLFMIYFNLIYTASDWMATGAMPGWLGVSWVHALALCMAAAALARGQGRQWRWPGRRPA